MEWIIESYDRKTDRDSENRFTSESAFLSAAEELLRSIWRGFVSATLPDGTIIRDDRALRALIELRAIAARMGWTVVEVYRDQGVSGAKSRKDRACSASLSAR